MWFSCLFSHRFTRVFLKRLTCIAIKKMQNTWCLFTRTSFSFFSFYIFLYFLVFLFCNFHIFCSFFIFRGLTLLQNFHWINFNKVDFHFFLLTGTFPVSNFNPLPCHLRDPEARCLRAESQGSLQDDDFFDAAMCCSMTSRCEMKLNHLDAPVKGSSHF